MILKETKYDKKNWRKAWNQQSWLRKLEGKILHEKNVMMFQFRKNEDQKKETE